MDNLPPGEARQNLSCTAANGAGLFRCLKWLAGRRDAFRALGWAAAVNLILFGLFLTCATPRYETNDDLMMQMIASGFLTGQPDAHLVFTNIIVGRVLQLFYETWGGCNWYMLYLLVTHYAALTAIASLVVSRRGGWLFTGLYVGFFLIVETRILLHLQFTTTAFLTGTAGLLLLVDGLQPRHPAHWPKIIAGLVMVSFMWLVREPAAFLLAAAAWPFVLERFGLAGWRRLLGTGVACAGIFLVFHGINHRAYQRDPAWAEFSEYNRIRGEIQVTALARFIPQAASTVGWSKNDGWMFSQFFYPDPEVYAGVPKMRLLFSRLQALAQTEPASSPGFSASYLFLPNLFWHGRDAAILMKLAILNAIWYLIAAGTSRARCLVTLLISYVLFVGLGFYLLKTARLPDRVSYNIPLFVNAICLYWATGFQRLSVTASAPGSPRIPFAPLWRAGTWRWALFVLVPIGAVLYLSSLNQLTSSLWSANADGRKLEHISHNILKPIRTLLPAPATPILIALPLDSVLEQCIVFFPAAQQAPFSFVPYGWVTHSPLFDKILVQQHLRPYPRSLVDRPDTFFLMEARWLDPLKTFYREHYGLDVRFEMVLNTDEMPEFKDCRLHLYQAHAAHEQALPRAAPR